ncbi:MAG: hypothetical protein ACE5K4_12640 [Candidatus Hydrothermarchaeota archaeon]
MKGTGVPFTLIKCRTDHRFKNSPMAIIGRDRVIFDGVGRSFGSAKNLSIQRETTTNSPTKLKKITIPIGVRRIRTFLLLLAALYNMLIHLWLKIISVTYAKTP